MQKKIMTFILAGTVACSVCSCGDRGTAESNHTETEIIQEEETSETEVDQKEEDGTLSFADFANLQFDFSSGAGAWRTILTIHADGSFSGEYIDSDMGDTGDDYPNGTMYQCNFSGQFTQPVKVNDYTYSMQISELNYVEEAGKEEIKDGVLYVYSDVYGLDNAEDILIYLPGAPLAELPEEFRMWVGYYDLTNIPDTELPFYALNNEKQQYGFSSYNIVDNLKDNLALIEDRAASLETSLETETLTQSEYNENTEALYWLWDSALNQIWEVLKQVLDTETMASLTAEELEWIAAKEQAVDEAGAEYEGGTMQPMIMNRKAAEITKTRVYELMELLD